MAAMASKKSVEIVQRFNGFVNRRDIHGLSSLLDESYRFVDAVGNQSRGRQAGLIQWTEFFQKFPDYRNVFETFEARGDDVIVTGRSECSEPALDGPSIWRASVLDSKLSLWQVYEDTPEVRAELGIEAT